MVEFMKIKQPNQKNICDQSYYIIHTINDYYIPNFAERNIFFKKMLIDAILV